MRSRSSLGQSRALRFALLLATLAARSLGAQTKLDVLQARWEAGKYDSIVQPLAVLRESAPPDARLRVDYLLATSLCRSAMAGRRSLGVQLLGAMQYHYGAVLGDSARAWLLAEARQCDAAGAGALAPPAVRPVTLVARPIAEINISGGKSFYDACGQAGAQGGEAMRINRVITTDVLAARLHALGAIDTAAAETRALLAGFGSDTAIAVVQRRFVIVSLAGHTVKDLQRIGETLDAYRQFYSRTYGLRLPDSVVTVLLVPEEYALRRVAERWHGVDPGNLVIGYSIVSDLSMVAIIPYKAQGTLAHELMHLMLSYSYADAPAWLNEGLASLYEVSTILPDSTINGLANWRGPVLARGGRSRPALDSLFAASDAEYRGIGAPRDDFRRALTYAQSRYFMMFLQDRGVLPAFVRAMRSQPFVVPDSAAGSVRVAVPGSALTRSVLASLLPGRDFAKDYEVWLARQLSSLPASAC